MSATQVERTRFRRRTWNVTKPHLPKHSSVPELQLLPQRRPRFNCRQCGFTNTLIPLCLWCTWTSEEAEHEFELSMPRARRASAPPRVFFHNNPTRVRPHDQKNASGSGISMDHTPTMNLFSKRNPQYYPLRLVPPRTVGTHIAIVHEEPHLGLPDDCDCDTVHQVFSSSKLVTSEELRWIEDAETDPTNVARVTKQLLPPPILSAERTQEGDELQAGVPSPGATNTIIDLRDPLRPLSSTTLPSLLPLSVERSKSEPMTALKSSRRLLIIGLPDAKRPSSAEDDSPTLISKYDLPNYNGTKASSPLAASPQQHFRTLRRKKPLNTSIPNPGATEPISISLTLHSTPSKRNVASRPDSQTRPFKTQSHPQSVSTESSDPTTPPMTPKHLPPTSLPAAQSTNGPGSSPVRLGHPSRPYYTAIRKGGISPSPSRPSSVSGPSPSSSTRPRSYQPPSSFQFGTSLGGTSATSTTARHLSMSAMFTTPFSSSSQGTFSAFSITDADNDNLHRDDTHAQYENDEEGEELPILPPTPAPSRFSFSLPRDVHRVARKVAAKLPSSSHLHSHSDSLSHARSKAARGSGMGFSMSGETELRMALAADAASAGVTEDGFRFRETVMPLAAAAANSSQAAPGEDVFGRGRSTNSKDSARKGHRSESFMGRVRRLRKGLKEMLNSSTPTPTTT